VSISSIPGGSSASWPSAASYTKSASPAGSSPDGMKLPALMNSGAPYDSVSVSLPNGMTVGLFNFSGTGFDSASLKAIEDFAQKMASQDIPGHPASGADGTAAASSTADGGSNVVGLDMIHVDLPNGISFEVRHSSGSGGQATDSAAVFKELTDTAEQLAEVFETYSPASTAAAAYASSQAAASSAANQVDTKT
jgi:hypothetical protein